MALTLAWPCARMEGEGAAKRAHGNAEHDAAQVGSPSVSSKSLLLSILDMFKGLSQSPVRNCKQQAHS